ncbi:hypothetical protein C8Q78DRAFT_207292 [Trametes maxima]|nr:hypothetical protein C8Q78DRAFT_207292 [Trametes maxima]
MLHSQAVIGILSLRYLRYFTGGLHLTSALSLCHASHALHSTSSCRAVARHRQKARDSHASLSRSAGYTCTSASCRLPRAPVARVSRARTWAGERVLYRTGPRSLTHSSGRRRPRETLLSSLVRLNGLTVHPSYKDHRDCVARYHMPHRKQAAQSLPRAQLRGGRARLLGRSRPVFRCGFSLHRSTLCETRLWIFVRMLKG